MEIVKRALDKYKIDKSHWAEPYLEAEQDLDFQTDKKYSQWNQQEADNRTSSGRPVLTIDQLGQFIHQVANDIRMNTPAIGVIPAGGGAKIETAEIIKGLIRYIEYHSQADDAYDMASESAIRCSIGFIRIDHDYEDDTSFNQELLIKRVTNPLSVYLDANSVEIDGRDAMHCSIIESIPVKEFKKIYSDKAAIPFDETINKRRELKDEDYIELCRFYEIEETEKEIALMEDGTTAPVTDESIEYKARRKIKKRTVKTYLLSGEDVLEEGVFPGIYIPIVPCYGEELWINGKRYLFSLIRKSKDAQRMYNYWKSLETELLQKQPQAPIMAAVGQIEDFAADWANPSKAMALRYNQTDAKGQPAPPPTRLEPPVIPTGVVNASRATVEDIKSTMGIYNASLGQRSNETSGIAIQRRQEEGGVATYHFADNLHKSIAHVGRILINAIPEVYDGARVIHIIDEEEKSQEVGINGQIVEAQEMHHILTQGKYDTRIVAGAAYTTRRQEAAEFFNQVLIKRPELLNVIGDLAFRYQDFTGSQAIANRLEKLIDPKLLDENNEIDPEKEQMGMALQQLEQVIGEMTQKIKELEAELKDKKAELILKAQSEENKTMVELKKIEIQALEAAIEKEKLKLEEAKVEAEIRYKFTELHTRNEEPAENFESESY